MHKDTALFAAKNRGMLYQQVILNNYMFVKKIKVLMNYI